MCDLKSNSGARHSVCIHYSCMACAHEFHLSRAPRAVVKINKHEIMLLDMQRPAAHMLLASTVALVTLFSAGEADDICTSQG